MTQETPQEAESSSETAAPLNKSMVLVFAKEGTQRDTICEVLKRDCQLDSQVVTEHDKCIEMLQSSNAGFFMHDWDAFDRTQNHKLHQSLVKHPEFAEVFKIIYTNKIAADLVALNAEIHIDRISTLAAVSLNLAGEINAAKVSRQNYTPIQSEIAAIQNNTTSYEQAKIDSIITEAYEKLPNDASVRAEYAALCYRKADLDKAEEIATDLLKENPRNVRAMTILSRVMMKRGQVDAAHKILEAADLLSPKNADRLLLIGEIFYKKGDTDQARSNMQEAVELNPGDQSTVETYAKFELGEGNVNEAAEFFKNSLSEEEIAGLLNTTAIQLVKNKDFEQAFKFYNLTHRTLKTDTYRHAVHYNMALAFKQQGKTTEALEAVKKALEIKPDFAKAQRLEKKLSESSKPVEPTTEAPSTPPEVVASSEDTVPADPTTTEEASNPEAPKDGETT